MDRGDEPTTWSRRQALKAGAVGTAITGAVWAAPSIVSIDAARAQTAPPTPLTGFAFVVNVAGDSVSVVDPTSSTAVGSEIGVGVFPRGVALTPDGSRAFVTNFADHSVSVIDTTATPPVVVGSPIGVAGPPVGIAINPAGTVAFVVNETPGSVSVIGLTANPPAVIGSPIAIGNRPNFLAFLPDGTKAFVSNGQDGTVSVIDATTNPPSVLGAAIAVGLAPDQPGVTPDGLEVWIPNLDSGSISIIDATLPTPAVIAPINLGGRPVCVVFSLDGTTAYVGDQDGSVRVFNTATRLEVGSAIDVGGDLHGIAISPDGSFVLTTNQANDDVYVIDVTSPSPSVVRTIAVGTGPAAITF